MRHRYYCREFLTPEQRLNRICEVLLRGIYLYAKKEGMIKEETAEAEKEAKKFINHNN